MLHTNTLTEFIRHNHKELCQVVGTLCKKIDVISVDDVIQDIYIHFYNRGIIERFNPEGRGYKIALMDAYLYPILRNAIRNKKKSSDNKFRKNRWIPSKLYQENDSKEHDEDVDLAYNYNQLAFEYRNIISENLISANPSDLRSELDSFGRYLLKKNKRYKLKRRRDKSKKHNGCSLYDVYLMLREGYNNRDIAYYYGVSNTFASNLRKKIRREMKKFGIEAFITKKTARHD